MIVGCLAILFGLTGCGALAIGLDINNVMMQIVGVGIFALGALAFIWNYGRGERRRHRELMEAVKGKSGD